MWRCGFVLVVVAALALSASGCRTRTPPEGTGVVGEPGRAPTTAVEFTYQCPVHETVTSESPGLCTEEGCGEFLVAMAPEGQEVEYYCDMHAEPVVSEEPGKCPECGMLMPARIAEATEDEDDEDEPESEEEL